jgi:hypothetical protein
MMPYLTSYHGGTFTDNEDNPSVEIDVTTLKSGVAVEGTVYPYRKYVQDGTENGSFDCFDYTMSRDELIVYRDMLTEIINKTR